MNPSLGFRRAPALNGFWGSKATFVSALRTPISGRCFKSSSTQAWASLGDTCFNISKHQRGTDRPGRGRREHQAKHYGIGVFLGKLDDNNSGDLLAGRD
jgi:hypothetical protein